ncbi:HAD family hydrolase [Lentzea sp. JNUCC 0626]|uniref:HAD family hydrolase n=1 Tax=Lentzea sp. JNUCC 0626 TaxID=3367513 RepID=UPI003749B77F
MSSPVRRVAAGAVVFDMDGVLIDSRSVIEFAWRDAAREYLGRDLTEDDVRDHIHGRNGSHTVATLFPDFDAARQREIWAHVDRIEETAPYEAIPGAAEFVLALADAGVTLALVTSSWPVKIEHALESIGVRPALPVVVHRDEVAQGKPHPEPYLTACARLGVRPADVVVFEDSVSGVRSAVDAGTWCVGVGTEELTGVLLTVPDFTGVSVKVSSGVATVLADGAAVVDLTV